MSNLFGNLGGGSSQSSSPFALGATTSQSGGSSLFGKPLGSAATTASTTPSLFAGLGGAASQPQQQTTTGGGLFNTGTSTSQPQQQQAGTTTGGLGGGLFSRIGTSQPQQQQTNAPAAGGLFGGLALGGGQTSQTAATSQPATTGLGSSLFGGAAAAKPPVLNLGGSAFGASLLGNTTNQGQLGQQQAPAQQNPTAQAGPVATSQPAYFDHLLERGKKRRNEDGGVQFGDLPTLQLGLGDISRKVRNLGQSGGSGPQGRGGDSRAHYLLAASGVSTGSTLRDLKSFNANIAPAAAALPTAPVFENDIEAYVSNLHSQSTLALIEEGLEQSKRDFDAFLEENVQMEWDAQRRRIYEHFGLVKPDSNLGASGSASGSEERGAFGKSLRRGRGLGASMGATAFGASGMAKSVIGAPGTKGGLRASIFAGQADKGDANGNMQQAGPEDRFMRDKQEKYAEKVKELNIKRVEGRVYPVLRQLADAENQSGGDATSFLVDAYKTLIEVTGEDPDVERPSDPGAVRERQYAKDYLDESITSKGNMAVRKRILDGSRRYLEKKFYNELVTLVDKNPKEANVGGVPSVINRFRGFVRVKAARRELGADDVNLTKTMDGDYCWVLIFYLLRAGQLKEAAQYVSDNERAIKSMDRNFPLYISTYVGNDDRRLTPDLQNRITSEYQQRTRLAPENSLDPYRQACYKIIGRCDLSRRSLEGLNQNMNDWLWLQFALAREINRVEEAAGDAFALNDVQETIKEIGQRHFAAAEGGVAYGTYFFLLVSAGMYEQAVAYLYQQNYVAAVHFAIGSAFYGLLRVSDFNSSDTDLMTYTTRQKPRINFGRLLGYYTRDFRSAQASTAADYLLLICLNSDLPAPLGPAQTALCHSALKELVLETREFAELLGDLRADGQRVRGAIEQRLALLGVGREEQTRFLHELTATAAAAADDAGRMTDAVLLFHLAEDFDSVTIIMNRAMSEALTIELGQEPMRLEPLKPRSNQQQKQQQPGDQQSPSLSLTSVSDPAQLAEAMIRLYQKNELMLRKIKPTNRMVCGALLQLCQARHLVESGRWSEAIDNITALDLLPMEAHSELSLIRSAAQTFNSLDPLLARVVPNLLLWTLVCLSRQRDVLRNTAFEDPARRGLAEQLAGKARDLMVYAGLVRYKMPPSVFEALARAGGEADGF